MLLYGAIETSDSAGGLTTETRAASTASRVQTHSATCEATPQTSDPAAQSELRGDGPAPGSAGPDDAAGRDLARPKFTHWYEPTGQLGLSVYTKAELPWMAADSVGLRYTGPLRSSLAEDLRKLLLATPQRFNHALLELDSDGGELGCVKEIVSVLREARGRMQLTTRVMEGSLCASGCIPLFMQGDNRKASGSSIWVFHGARRAFTNVPDPQATEEYLDLLSSRGMKQDFRAMLEADNRIYRPGSFILSGYELFAAHDSGVILELYPTWRQEVPVFPSGLGPR